MSIRKVLVILIVALTSLAGTWAHAQIKDFKGTIAKWTDQSKPGLLKVILSNGNVTIKTYNGKDAIITSHTTDDGGGNLVGRPLPDEIDGLKRLGGGAHGLAIFNDDKVISVFAVLANRRTDLDIQVPMKTSLNIQVNAGNVTVDGVEGEIEATTLHGAVTLTNVAGSVVAHSMNGKVVASLREVMAKKAMSFTSMNGSVDVTLPSTAKAALKLRTDHGEVYSDFDIKLPQSSQAPGFSITMAKDGTINNGGPDVELRAFNGNIFIRKGTK